MEISRLVSTWSKDPKTKVGAVIVKDRHILSTGFNGFPVGLDDSLDLYSDRNYKLSHVIHAELNAILNRGSNDIQEAKMYCTYAPCLACAMSIVQAGISQVIFPSLVDSSWRGQQEDAIREMQKVGIECKILS